jgi:AsmA protein
MSAWFRTIAIALGVVVLVVAAGAVWLVTGFDPADHKSVAIDWVKVRYQRTLTIDGPIRLALFPRIEVRLSDASLSEAGSTDTFATLDDAALAVELLPLLRRRLAVDRAEVHGLRLVLLRDAKGRRNIDDLLRPAPAATDAVQPLQFDLNRILLSNVRARVKDEPAGIDGELVIKELNTGRIASQVESGLELVAQFGFKAPALKGELSGFTHFTPDFATGSLQLADMKLGYKGDAPGASSIDALLDGSLAWDGAQSSLSAKGLNLRVTANTAGLRLAGSTLAIERFALDPARRSFALAQLQLRIKGSQGGKPLALDLDWPELDVRGDVLKGSALAGKLAFGTELPLAVTFKSDAPSGNFDNVRVPAFEARVSSASVARRIAGSLRSELVLQPGNRAALLDKIDLQLRLDEPGLKPLNLLVKGNAVAGAGNTRWNLAGDVNGNSFNAEGTAAFTGITPQVKTQVRFQALDLNGLMDTAAPGGSSAAAAHAPIDLAPLRSVNGAIGLRIGSLALRHYRLTDVGLDATLDAGMLRVSSFRGKVWGGSVAGSAFADARASRMALKGAAEGVNIRALLQDVAEQDLLEGSGRVDVDIESAGRTMAELKARLKGRAAMQLRDGAVKGVNLAKGLRQARAALTLKQDALLRAAKTEKTDFSELNASFVIDAGVARTTDVDLKSPYLRVEGDGGVDVVKNRIDASLRAAVADTAKGQDGAELAALKGISVPVQLNGPFDAMSWKIVWSAVAGTALKSQARTEVEKRLKDKLGPKLELKPPAPPAPVAPAAPGAAASAVSAEDKLKSKLKGLMP